MTNSAWLVLLLAGAAWGQTRLAWRQLAPGGTQPRVAWQKGLGGHPIRGQQAPVGDVTARVVGDTIEVAGVVQCTVTMRRTFSGLVQLVFYSGRVAVLAGHSTGSRYEPTTEHVDIAGPCVPVETVTGHYPKGVHAFIYFASVQQPTGSAVLRGVYTPFVPVSYSMDVSGLIGVTGLGGAVEWTQPPGTIMNGRFQGLVINSLKP